MKQEKAKRLKPGDHVITMGTNKPLECVVDTVSEYGCVNVHDVDNWGSYYRTYDEIFAMPTDKQIIASMSIAEIFYSEREKEWTEYFTIPAEKWIIGDKHLLGKIIVAKLTDDFCGGMNGRYAVLSKNNKDGLWYEFGEEVPTEAIERYTIIK